jgi:hypothetical protein
MVLGYNCRSIINDSHCGDVCDALRLVRSPLEEKQHKIIDMKETALQK